MSEFELGLIVGGVLGFLVGGIIGIILMAVIKVNYVDNCGVRRSN